ncbi:hypothetical protein GCM10027445_33540 [Amycolatopsis endophytica]|uniref:Uncharacterized protein n=1 Tax=Amycolatopsis endophytica TaxID=860233 RepID=A0A853B0N2_9PSEU|nr:hypothetical protein [Amycolatopsis endophytica]NYI88417.1 hypothetical protein [Amycolatopsis endophytica]
MYGWIWRRLPGPVAVKALTATVLVLGVIAVLLFVVFPWLDPLLPFNQVSVN